jgi:hypothetical protein
MLKLGIANSDFTFQLFSADNTRILIKLIKMIDAIIVINAIN